MPHQKTLEQLLEQRAVLTGRLIEVQREVENELGAVDQREYRRRLQERGLLAEWEALRQSIEKIKPLIDPGPRRHFRQTSIFDGLGDS